MPTHIAIEACQIEPGIEALRSVARYSTDLKERAAARLPPPESVEVCTVSQKLGISVATLERWRESAIPALAQPEEARATRAQRHAGEDRTIPHARHALYLRARAWNPRRGARDTGNWKRIGIVTLNPERDAVVTATVAGLHNTRSAA